MLMVSVLAGTLLLSRDRVVCLPIHPTPPSNNQSLTTEGFSPSQSGHTALTPPSSTPQPQPLIPSPRSSAAGAKSLARGLRTNLDYQQYIYISQVCYHEALPWFSRFFPYVALLQSLVLLASGCFWFHFPLTSSRIEHFLTILGKCCESPWTSRALSHAARLDRNQGRPAEEEKDEEDGERLRVHLLSPVPAASLTRQSSLDSGTDSPLLVRSDSASTAAPPSPCPSTLSRTSSLSTLSFTDTACPQPPVSRVIPDATRPTSMDRSDGEQARALFERVRRFRAHCESSDIIYKVRVESTFWLCELTICDGILCVDIKRRKYKIMSIE